MSSTVPIGANPHSALLRVLAVRKSRAGVRATGRQPRCGESHVGNGVVGDEVKLGFYERRGGTGEEKWSWSGVDEPGKVHGGGGQCGRGGG